MLYIYVINIMVVIRDTNLVRINKVPVRIASLGLQSLYVLQAWISRKRSQLFLNDSLINVYIG